MMKAIDKVKSLNKTSWPMSEAIGIVIVEQLERIADALEKQSAKPANEIERVVSLVRNNLQSEKLLSPVDKTADLQELGGSHSKLINAKVSFQMQPEIIELIELQKRSAELTVKIMKSLKIETEKECLPSEE
ncbi:hypothetical protein SDC9_192478 [bioreactor metagenome]|uniref:Uncharacterized protein n=1 Tax=bioreactor metagenome TaxID=1076179 RepID=A0A645I0U4_9ZZZZ